MVTFHLINDIAEGAMHSGAVWFHIAHVTIPAGIWILCGGASIIAGSAGTIYQAIGTATNRLMSTNIAGVTQRFIYDTLFYNAQTNTDIYIWSYGDVTVYDRGLFGIRLK